VSKNNRVLALIALMFVSTFAVGGGVFLLTSGRSQEIETLSAHLNTMRVVRASVTELIGNQESALDDYMIARDPESLARFNDSVAAEVLTEAQLDVAAPGLPEVLAALKAVQAASLAWRTDVAAPAIEANELLDPVGLSRFRSAAATDHDDVGTALDRTDRALIRADADIDRRSADVALVTMFGVLIGFGFLTAAFGVALLVVRRFGHALEQDANESNVLNRFTEVTSFASEDHEVAASNLVALGRLVGPDASVTHILNRSMDRAVPESSTGDAIAEILPMRALDRCAGVLRGAMYVTDDLSDDLAVHCPIYPASAGTLACIPLASGEMVGAVHLYWRKPRALPLQRRPNIARITEHAALAIGNRRLLAALHGQATTDPRTGLMNSRAFDEALEAALQARSGSQTISVLMLDIDEFKKFNDRHGHPAGDEALRSFAAVLRSCMRDDDMAARYGGEEFAVMLLGDDGAAPAIAERIRARIEATVISLSAGVTDHITVSIGFASAPEHGVDRVTLLRLADEALYRAKEQGRNRVVRITERRASKAPDASVAPRPRPTPITSAVRSVSHPRADVTPIPAEG
jgi:diguanylate cyclase (GGDEF)-like protein